MLLSRAQISSSSARSARTVVVDRALPNALIATPRDRQLPAAAIAAPSESGSALTTTAHMEGDDKAEESSGAEDGEVEDEDELDWEY